MTGPTERRALRDRSRSGLGRGVGTSVDFDVRGAVGVRLLDGSESDVACVRRQLGGPTGPLGRAPDVVVRFVDELPLQGATLVSSRASSFTEEGFLIMQESRSGLQAQVPLWELGGACEIVCESGMRSVPLLLEAVKMAALKKGIVPLPASAFEFEGIGVLVIGGERSGRTTSLLAFARHGGLFVADDLVFVRADGREMFGLDTALTVTTEQVAELPNGEAAISAADVTRVALFERLEGLRQWAFEGASTGSLRERLGRRVEHLLRQRLTIECRPASLFSNAVLPSAEPRQVFLTLLHDAPDIRVKGVTTEEFIDRLANLLQADDLPLLGRHLDYRMAALGQPEAFIDRAHELRHTLLERAFAGKEAFVIRRPPGVHLEALFRAMARVRESPRGRSDPGATGDNTRGWRSTAQRGKARRLPRGWSPPRGQTP